MSWYQLNMVSERGSLWLIHKYGYIGASATLVFWDCIFDADVNLTSNQTIQS